MNGSRLGRPADVAVVETEAVVFVSRLPSGPMHALSDSAAVIWREAVSGDHAGLAERVAARQGVSADDIRAHVEAFVDQLIADGFLEERPGPAFSDLGKC